MTALAFSAKSMSRSEMYCERCQSQFVIFRKKNELRGNGHIKHMWCYRCKSITPHIEVQST